MPTWSSVIVNHSFVKQGKKLCYLYNLYQLNIKGLN